MKTTSLLVSILWLLMTSAFAQTNQPSIIVSQPPNITLQATVDYLANTPRSKQELGFPLSLISIGSDNQSVLARFDFLQNPAYGQDVTLFLNPFDTDKTEITILPSDTLAQDHLPKQWKVLILNALDSAFKNTYQPTSILTLSVECIKYPSDQLKSMENAINPIRLHLTNNHTENIEIISVMPSRLLNSVTTTLPIILRPKQSTVFGATWKVSLCNDNPTLRYFAPIFVGTSIKGRIHPERTTNHTPFPWKHRSQFNSCSITTCNTIGALNCGAEIDGPLFYIDLDTEEKISTCGGYCMTQDNQEYCRNNCPPKQWQCN